MIDIANGDKRSIAIKGFLQGCCILTLICMRGGTFHSDPCPEQVSDGYYCGVNSALESSRIGTKITLLKVSWFRKQNVKP